MTDYYIPYSEEFMKSVVNIKGLTTVQFANIYLNLYNSIQIVNLMVIF